MKSETNVEKTLAALIDANERLRHENSNLRSRVQVLIGLDSASDCAVGCGYVMQDKNTPASRRLFVLKFLADRGRAIFTADQIAQRLKSSKMCDSCVTHAEVDATLRELASDGFVDFNIDFVSTEPKWYATSKGIKAMILHGREEASHG